MRPASCFFLLTLCNWKYGSGRTVSPCKENTKLFNQCLEDELNKLIPTLKHGWADGDLPGLDPITLPPTNATHTNDEMEITVTTRDVSITGMADSKVQAVKSNNFDIMKLEIVLKIPELVVKGHYESEGEMATFPLSSEGPFNILMDDVTLVCIIYLDRFKLGKEGRLIISSLSLDAVPGQIQIKTAKYFDGDNALGKTFEGYLNKNAFELYNMVKAPLMNYMSNLATIMINSYMAQIPDNQLIDNSNENKIIN